MAQLLLRGLALGPVKGVLFDKDGTLSISEPQLITLAQARVFLCLERVDAALHGELRQLLQRAYGLRSGREGSGGASICPAGITAVAHRDHNLIATATALVQVGLGWPEALRLSEEVFALADRIDARRAGTATTSTRAGTATTSTNAGTATTSAQAGTATTSTRASTANPASEAAMAKGSDVADGQPGPSRSSDGRDDSRPRPAGSDEQAAGNGSEQASHAPSDTASPSPPGSTEATHLDSSGMPSGGTSRTTEGLRNWLEQLRSASIACAVISNDDVAGIEHFLASHGLEEFFCAIWSAEHRPRKPDPGAVHGLCAELGLQAADCALIGDANSDLRMAVAAGIPHQLALGYTAAWSTPPPLAEPHPQVHHWRELSLL